ncbi:MAG: carboxyl-terminal processing protease [Sphingobacteriales bacterium]|jgi:carboxyl-terminal processing protease
MIPLVASIFMIVGIYVGMKFGTQGLDSTSLRFAAKQDKLSEVINYIDYSYVDPVKKEELIEDAINNLLDNLDPHSKYISAKDLEMYNEPLEGNFEGIGVQFRVIRDTVTVIRPIKGGPSERVGIIAGDKIVLVDDSLVAGVDVSNATIMSLLKGPKRSEVVVQVSRVGQDSLMPFTIVRDRIPIYSVDAAYMLNDETGYVKLAHFAKTTGHEMLDSLRSLENQGMKNLVFDLRGNGGGILQAAIMLTEVFLEKDKLIVYTEGKSQPRQDYRTTSTGRYANLPMVVLIDEQSASASEILTGALQDNDRGIIVGRRSFGKGLVQEQVELGDRSALRLTVARYYTPTGRSIQKPYGANDNYEDDIKIRFENGEFYSADSIQFSDSLVYITPKGDTVYGGGGIMPDIFIPLEKGADSGWYGSLFYSGALNDVVFELSDRARKTYLGEEAFITNYGLQAGELKMIAKKLGLKKLNKDVLSELRLKAFIARGVYGENAFYRIWNAEDAVIGRSLKELEKTSQKGE